MGWSGKNEGSTSLANFYGILTHINGVQVKVTPWMEVNGNSVVDTTDGKEALASAVNALLTDPDFTFVGAGLNYEPDNEVYTP